MKIKWNSNQFGFFILTLVLALIFLFPILYSLMSSFKSNGEILANPAAFPHAMRLDNFIYLMNHTQFFRGLLNSSILTVVSEAVIMILIPMCAYGIARRETKGSYLLYLYILMGMMIPFQVYMIPLFKELKTFGIFGSMSGPILVYISGSVSFGILLFTSFLKGIPREIEESASIDGCSDMAIYWRIVFPLLSPATASMVILNGLGIWNDFLLPMLALPDKSQITINVIIFSFVGQFASRWDVVFAGTVCAMIPALIVFVLFQRYFVEGITAGAIKG